MKNLPDGVTISSGASQYASVQCASDAEALSFASSGAVDTFLAISGADFVFDGSSGFALTAAGGILTYTGPNIIVQARAILSMTTVADTNPGAAFCIFSLNNEFLAEAPFSSAQIAAGFMATRHDSNNGGGNRIFELSCARQLTLTSGDTLRILGGNSQAIDLTINSISILVNQVA